MLCIIACVFAPFSWQTKWTCCSSGAWTGHCLHGGNLFYSLESNIVFLPLIYCFWPTAEQRSTSKSSALFGPYCSLPSQVHSWGWTPVSISPYLNRRIDFFKTLFTLDFYVNLKNSQIFTSWNKSIHFRLLLLVNTVNWQNTNQTNKHLLTVWSALCANIFHTPKFDQISPIYATQLLIFKNTIYTLCLVFNWLCALVSVSVKMLVILPVQNVLCGQSVI